MPTVTVNTDVDVDIGIEDFDDDDLIEEVESRGYKVYESHTPEEKNLSTLADEMEEVVWRYTRGYIEDAMLLLERLYPDLYGLHKRIK